MSNIEIFRSVDYTQLNPTATWKNINTLCDEAIKLHAASVCVPPAYIKAIKDIYGDQIKACTVVGFPFGYNETTVKATETEEALQHGAEEIDMVVNISDVKNGTFSKVEDEIEVIKSICGSNILKVIVETCYLTEEEKIAVCEAVTEMNADYISTSTGFGTGGATLADVELFKKHIGENVKIKAVGGIKTQKELAAFLQAGCHRIGMHV